MKTQSPKRIAGVNKAIASSVTMLMVSVSMAAMLTSEAFALENLQLSIGHATTVVDTVNGALTGNDCGDVQPTPPDYHAGQDVEYHLVSGGYPDPAKAGTYVYEVPCRIPVPIQGSLYGYGSPNGDQLPDGSAGWAFLGQPYIFDVHATLQRGSFTDFPMYLSLSGSVSGPYTKVMASDFMTQYEAGAFSGSEYSIPAISPEFGNDIVDGGDGDDLLSTMGGQDKLYGGRGNDIFQVFKQKNNIVLAADPDADPNWDAATLYGGAGDDVYYLADPKDKVIENPGEGFDMAFCPSYNPQGFPDNITTYGVGFSYETDIEVIAGECTSLPPNFTGRYFPNLYLQPFEVQALNGKGTSLSDAIKYYEASLAFDAGAGDDLVVTGGGDDEVAGGTGNDIMSPGDGNDQVSGGDGDDIVVDTEGSDDANPAAPFSAVAMSGVPRLMAGLPAGTSGDYFDGGAGTDTLRYSVQRSEATVTPQPDGSVAVEIGSSRDVLLNVERLQFTDQTIQVGNDAANKITGTNAADKLIGFAGNDNIIGNGGNDEIDGGTGADIMSGGDGDDSYIVDNAGDKVKENARPGSGADTVYTALPAYTMPANVENLVYTGEAGFSGKGNKSGNRMSGGPAADRLDGQKGTDVMIGLAGDDTYVVDSPADLVTEEPDGGIDAVISGVSITTLSQNVEVLSLSKGNINGTGNALDNLIIGSSSQNILSGGDGTDTLIGGLGNDTFYGETSASPGDDADTVSYAGAKKAIVFSLSNTLAGQNTGGAGMDRIYEISSIENLTGSSFNDTLTGNLGPNVLSGTDGNDTLLGLTGTDVLVGGKGLDLIDAGADADADRVAYFAPTDSPPGAMLRDQVTNFTPGTDLIDLSAIDANTASDGDQAFAFNGMVPAANAVWYAVTGPDVVLSGDVSGDAVADFEVLVKGVAGVEQTSFAL